MKSLKQHFQPQGYRFDDLLSFYQDGAGNCENFFRRDPGEPPIGTVDWDHETREISEPKPQELRKAVDFCACSLQNLTHSLGANLCTEF